MAVNHILCSDGWSCAPTAKDVLETTVCVVPSHDTSSRSRSGRRRTKKHQKRQKTNWVEYRRRCMEFHLIEKPLTRLRLRTFWQRKEKTKRCGKKEQTTTISCGKKHAQRNIKRRQHNLKNEASQFSVRESTNGEVALHGPKERGLRTPPTRKQANACWVVLSACSFGSAVCSALCCFFKVASTFVPVSGVVLLTAPAFECCSSDLSVFPKDETFPAVLCVADAQTC